MLPAEPGQLPPTTSPKEAAPGALATVEEQALPGLDPAPSYGARRSTFHPGSLPRHMAITVLDLDVTKRCNLRCRYCFKSDRVQPDAPDMTLDTAIAAVDWLMAASYRADELWVNLFGGEPLLQFPLIRQLVPYAKRRAHALGKGIQFGCTTNLTLIDEEVAAFFRQWGMGWHCSIDGPPDVQDYRRPGVGGAPSSDHAERGARLVLKDRPRAMARATVTAATVGSMFRSVLYFETLGFQSMGFAIGDETEWTAATLEEYDRQLGLIREHARDEWYRRGVDRYYGALDYIISSTVAGRPRLHACGCGRGTVLIDERGDLWPCHRFDGADLDSGGQGAWRFGNILRPGFDHLLHLAFLEKDRRATFREKCADCVMRNICAGGCAPANLTHTGSLYHPAGTACAAARIAHKHALRLHDELHAERNGLFMKKFHSQTNARSEKAAAPVSTKGAD